jgi:predicted PurR-regulated permease PerM
MPDACAPQRVLEGGRNVQARQVDGAVPLAVERDASGSTAPQDPGVPPRQVTRTVTLRHELPTGTILRVIVVVAAAWLLGRLWSQLLLFVIALLLALAIEPAVTWLESRGQSRARAVGLILMLIVGTTGLLLAIVVPPTVEQGQRLIDNLPGYIDQVEGRLEEYPTLQQWIQDARDTSPVDSGLVLRGALSTGGGLATGVSNSFILLAATAYMLLDAPRIFAWLLGGMSPHNQARTIRIREALTRIVGGYLRGQLITSALFGGFAYVTLSLAGVPEPLALAVLAAFFDAIPLVGATLATIPAVLLALTVSVPVALVVLVLYIAYQQVENYVISPRVFQGELDIPALAVLVAITFGSSLFGVAGALLALPIAAAIPAVARAWRDTPAAA